MSLARIAHVRLAADGLYWYMDMLAERISQHIQRRCWHSRDCGNPCCSQGASPANMPSEAVMRIGSVIIIVWLIIGAIAAGQRHKWLPPESDETLVDVAPSPPRSRLEAGGQRMVGFLVVRPGVLAR